MKLTKGKLSKIYNKKKQTMRKFKIKSKISNKKGRGKTFRKKRPLNLNKKTLKNIEQIQFRNGRMITGGEPTAEELAKLEAAKERIASSEASLDEQMEEGPSLPVQAEPVDDDLKKGVSVEAQPFSEPYGPQVQRSSSGSGSGSRPNFDSVAQGLKEYIDHTVAVALASSSSSSSSSNEGAQNPVSSVSTAVETTEEGIRNLNSPSSSGNKEFPDNDQQEGPLPSAPPAEEGDEISVSPVPSAPPAEEGEEEP
jgi:hypothetical protein